MKFLSVKLKAAPAALFILLTIGIWALVPAQEREISQKDLPTAVLSAFHDTYPQGTIKGVSEEVDNGQTYYEIESIEGTIERDILFLPDGTIHEVEEGINVTALPAAVVDAIKAKYAKGKIERAEKKTEGKTVQYELIVESGEQNFEILLNPDGNIVKTEKKTETDEQD